MIFSSISKCISTTPFDELVQLVLEFLDSSVLVCSKLRSFCLLSLVDDVLFVHEGDICIDGNSRLLFSRCISEKFSDFVIFLSSMFLLSLLMNIWVLEGVRLVGFPSAIQSTLPSR